jgi:hypothetical protein
VDPEFEARVSKFLSQKKKKIQNIRAKGRAQVVYRLPGTQEFLAPFPAPQIKKQTNK